jgi:hypothetical protein
MAENQIRIQDGRTYRVEVDGVEVQEFTAETSREILVEGLGQTSAFVLALPGRYDDSMRDNYTQKPVPPVGLFRPERGKSRAMVDGWRWLLEQPAGVYYISYGELGQVKITIPQEV